MTILAKEEHALREEMVRIAASFSSAAMPPARQATSRCYCRTAIFWRRPPVRVWVISTRSGYPKWTRRANGSTAINRLKRCVFIWRCIAITLAARPWYICTARSTALSCLEGLDPQNVIRPFTPYVVMRMGDIPLVPYYRPGDDRIARDLAALAARHQAFLLANHGPVVCGENLQEAANNTEELEETAKLIFILGERPIRYLTTEEIAQLRR